MSQENMRLFEQGKDALDRGDMEAFLSLVDEHVVWIAARSAVEGAYHGHDGVRKFFADNEENFEVFEADWREVRDVDDERILAIGRIHLRGRGSTVETDIPVAGIFTFKRGKLVKWEDFRDRAHALQAAGLRE
jgi:ketosteroid isomerase-like protein